jgi:host factor-I protein
MEASVTAIEPLFLSHALAQGAALRIGQMNKSEHEGVIRAIGRYEINVEEHGTLITVLKQDIAYLTAGTALITVPAAGAEAGPQPAAGHPEPAPPKPNIQQEFLDKTIHENHSVTVFLVTGQRLRSNIEAYDNFTVLLREGGRQHLCYKHAITTINR